MEYLVGSAEMTRLDKLAQDRYGIPGIVLMEHAALHAWRSIAALKPARVTVVAGPGNNGGDGLALARIAHVSGRCEVCVIEAGCERADSASPAGVHYKSCRELGIRLISFRDAEHDARGCMCESDIIVDAVLGTGLAGAVREPVRQLIEAISSARTAGAVVVSLDIPSGLRDGASALEDSVAADRTLTFGWAKHILYTPWGRSRSGDIISLDIGFPQQLEAALSEPRVVLAAHEDLRRFLKPVSQSAHKGVRGHVAVCAGSVGMTGAARLSCEAAIRSRAALVTLVSETIPEGLSASIMTRFAPDTLEGMNGLTRSIDALLIGPGWGRGAARADTLPELLACARRGVIDADGLAALKDIGRIQLGDWILTPHPAEAARLADCSTDEVLVDPLRIGGFLASAYGCTVVIKAETTHVISADGRIVVIDGHNPALACGGSGDVLAGVIAGILATGGLSFDAAVAGVLAHAEAGRRLFLSRGWFAADELPREISRVLAGVPEVEQGNHGQTATE
ncbi:MAG: NAD(P)H-hydrate dehydratase [Spirochaetaceae bacterium]|nr:MAG: NAD(P)H-hydrate dehydratase [Spirochaetaceae bacterium]